MDLVFCSDAYLNSKASKKYDTKGFIYKLKAFLQKNDFIFGDNIELITKARVPLCKYLDNATGLRVDVSFENLSGLTAVDTFLRWKDMYPAMPIIVTIVKHFLAMRGLNEPVNGGIGGFSVTCMVMSMLQMMPEVQARAMAPGCNLGEMLLEFFDLYGNRFDYKTTAIRVSPPSYVPKVSLT